MAALATTAPAGSEIVPVIVPRSLWASATKLRAVKNIALQINRIPSSLWSITDARRARLALHPMSDRMACQGKNLDLLNLNRDVLDLNGGLDYGNGVLYLVSSCTLNPF